MKPCNKYLKVNYCVYACSCFCVYMYAYVLSAVEVDRYVVFFILQLTNTLLQMHEIKSYWNSRKACKGKQNTGHM